MTVIIVIVNEKGGVGKTPTAINLAFALCRAGRKVKIVDADPQASVTKYFLEDGYTAIEHTLYHLLMLGLKIPAIPIIDGLDFLPAINGIQPLTNAEAQLPLKYRFDFQLRLRKMLAKYKEDDYIVIDTPGNVSLFTALALTAAHLAIVPVKTEISAEQATEDIMQEIRQLQGTEDEPGNNPELQIWGILPTLYEGQVKHHRQVVDILKYKYGSLVYPEPSKKSNEYNNAHALKTDVSARDAELGRYWDRIAASVITGRNEKAS
jgi:chromosome partitioning protein